MLKQSLALLALVAVAGCANPPPPGEQAQAGGNDVELAAYAGAHPYPTTQQARSDMRAAAIISPQTNELRIYNFSTEPIRDAEVWVNQSYVKHINGIAPHSSVLIPFTDLYNSFGQKLSVANEHVQLVQIQQGGELYTLQGPATQQQ